MASRAHPKNAADTQLGSDSLATLSATFLALAERAAKGGSWSWHVRTGEIHWSEGMYALFGLDPAKDLPGFEAWAKRLHPQDREAAEARIAESVRTRSVLFNHYRIILPDGQMRWVDAYGDLTVDVHGVVERLSGFCVDATHRIQMEAEKAALDRDLTHTRILQAQLLHSQEQLELALEASGLAMWDWDIAEHRGHVGPGWLEVLGYPPGALSAREEDWLAYIHPDDAERYQRNVLDCLQGNTAFLESEHRFRHYQGHWVHLQVRGRVTHRAADGAPLRMVGTMLDVTMRKRLNAEGTDLLNRIASLIADTTSGKPRAHAGGDSDARLSRRQRQILALVAKGMTSAEIAKQLNISTDTAIGHRRELMKKLGLHNAVDLTRYAITNHLTD